ncbi:MAG: hypothetical protein KBD63_03110 [Bacteriovoracaceae bacterium]|nr:hypothetical protein [Bacteriovoracaceae bacterium]
MKNLWIIFILTALSTVAIAGKDNNIFLPGGGGGDTAGDGCPREITPKEGAILSAVPAGKITLENGTSYPVFKAENKLLFTVTADGGIHFLDISNENNSYEYNESN